MILDEVNSVACLICFVKTLKSAYITFLRKRSKLKVKFPLNPYPDPIRRFLFPEETVQFNAHVLQCFLNQSPHRAPPFLLQTNNDNQPVLRNLLLS